MAGPGEQPAAQQPASVAELPSAATQQPAANPATPGAPAQPATPLQPGAAPAGNPGNVVPQPAAPAPAAPGAVPAAPGAVPAAPGAVPAAPGAVPAAPVGMPAPAPAAPNPVPNANDPTILFAVNAGGTAFTAEDGTEFAGDHFFTGGALGMSSTPVTGTQNPSLYATERWGEFTYEFPVTAGSYDVTLFLAETFFGPANPGNRVFDVSVEGQVVLDDFDPMVKQGSWVADTFEVPNVMVTDGSLTVHFEGSVDEANLNAILVRGEPGSGLMPTAGAVGTTGNATLVPDGCAQTAPPAPNDFILFDGGPLEPPVGNIVSLHGGWVLDEVWAAGEGALLDVVATGNGTAISYGNIRTFTGFKLTPPIAFGVRQNFLVSGVDLYIEGSAGATFGLRVIKPGENEGMGGAPTTTWTRNAQGQQDHTLTAGCNLLQLTMPPEWDAASQPASRFILEVKGGWDTTSTLQVRRMVVKGFSVAP